MHVRSKISFEIHRSTCVLLLIPIQRLSERSTLGTATDTHAYSSLLADRCSEVIEGRGT